MSTLIDARQGRATRERTVVLRVPPPGIWIDPVPRRPAYVRSDPPDKPGHGPRVERSVHLENRERALAWRIDVGAPAPDKRARTSGSRQVGDPAASACTCTCALRSSSSVVSGSLRLRAHGRSHCRSPVAGAGLPEPERRPAHPALHPAPGGHELPGGMAKKGDEVSTSRCVLVLGRKGLPDVLDHAFVRAWR
jgi:hypothetical protein